MKILLTGHKGFIGSNMLKALAGHDVKTFDWGEDPNLLTTHDRDVCIHRGVPCCSVSWTGNWGLSHAWRYLPNESMLSVFFDVRAKTISESENRVKFALRSATREDTVVLLQGLTGPGAEITRSSINNTQTRMNLF